MYREIVTSFHSRCQVVSTELVPPVVIVPSAKRQSPSLERKTYRHTAVLDRGPAKSKHQFPFFLYNHINTAKAATRKDYNVDNKL